MNIIKRSLMLISFLLMIHCDKAEKIMENDSIEIYSQTELIDQDLNLISDQIDAINEELESDF